MRTANVRVFMQNISLEGSVAVVTGSGRGIGLSIARQLAKAGATIALVDINQSLVEAAAAGLNEEFGQLANAFVADLTDADQVKELFENIYAKLGKVDILVNNAGITRDSLMLRMKESEWDAVINTNLRSAFLCTKAVVKAMMKQRHGKIINISSVVGIMGNSGQANYCASKAGLIGFTKSLARELGSRGVNVNAVAPGYIQTDMTEKLPESAKEAMLSQVPLNRPGQPEDVSKAVFFLASPLADYLTGQVICVDGGMAM
mgnify:FL=1